MPVAHATVKQELLVRYLDAWTPTVLHGHRRVTYVELLGPDPTPAGPSTADPTPADPIQVDPSRPGRGEAGASTPGGSALAALRVFGEFADLLDRHTLTMLLVGASSGSLRSRLSALAAEYNSAGLAIVDSHGPMMAALRSANAIGSPIFGWFDTYASAAPPIDAVSTVAGNGGSEVLLALPDGEPATPYLEALTAAGLGRHARIELIDAHGAVEVLVFGTASEKSLEKFKDELWALDEYAGIRLRDPSDDEHTALDISVNPQLGPLRRALARHLADTGGSTVAQLRSWAVHETVYRAEDATKAVQSLVTTGVVTREPASGRLAPTTMIRPKSP